MTTNKAHIMPSDCVCAKGKAARTRGGGLCVCAKGVHCALLSCHTLLRQPLPALPNTFDSMPSCTHACTHPLSLSRAHTHTHTHTHTDTDTATGAGSCARIPPHSHTATQPHTCTQAETERRREIATEQQRDSALAHAHAHAHAIRHTAPTGVAHLVAASLTTHFRLLLLLLLLLLLRHRANCTHGYAEAPTIANNTSDTTNADGSGAANTEPATTKPSAGGTCDGNCDFVRYEHGRAPTLPPTHGANAPINPI